MYMTTGPSDVMAIVEMPAGADAVAVNMAIAASGAAQSLHTIQAWSNALALWEAMKRADKAGQLDGVGILKEGFETMKGYDLFLGGASLTYTAEFFNDSATTEIYTPSLHDALPIYTAESAPAPPRRAIRSCPRSRPPTRSLRA